MDTATTLLAGLTILLALFLLLFGARARTRREQDINAVKALVKERSRAIEERSRMMDKRSKSLDFMQSRLDALDERNSRYKSSPAEDSDDDVQYPGAQLAAQGIAAGEGAFTNSGYDSDIAVLSALSRSNPAFTYLTPLKEVSPILSNSAALRGVDSAFLLLEAALYPSVLAALKGAASALMVPEPPSYTSGQALVRPPMFSRCYGMPAQWTEHAQIDEETGVPEWVRSTAHSPSAGADNPHRKEDVKRYGFRKPPSSEGPIFQTAPQYGSLAFRLTF